MKEQARKERPGDIRAGYWQAAVTVYLALHVFSVAIDEQSSRHKWKRRKGKERGYREDLCSCCNLHTFSSRRNQTKEVFLPTALSEHLKHIRKEENSIPVERLKCF